MATIRCAALAARRESRLSRGFTALAGDFGGDLDPAASLRALARRLEAAHEEDPSNAMVARELRATLLVLGSGSGKPAPDIADAIRASWEIGG